MLIRYPSLFALLHTVVSNTTTGSLADAWHSNYSLAGKADPLLFRDPKTPLATRQLRCENPGYGTYIFYSDIKDYL